MVIAGSMGPAISQSEIMYGSAEVPCPLTTPFAVVKFASDSMRMGPRGVLARTRVDDIGAIMDKTTKNTTKRSRVRAALLMPKYDVSRRGLGVPSGNQEETFWD